MMLPIGLRKLLYRDYFARHPRVRKRQGCRWLLDYRNHVDRKIILGKRFESRQIARMKALIKEFSCDVFVDVGANFGLYSVLVGRFCGEIRKIYAIEPQARNFHQLCANVFLNGLSDVVTAIQSGASSERRKAVFLENVNNHTGMSRLAETAPEETIKRNFREVEVWVEPLDEMIDWGAKSRIALKIDVEGHELEVLAGARRLMSEVPCVIQMEILGEQDGRVRSMTEEFGLVLRDVIDHDHYFINQPMQERVMAERASVRT